MESAGEGLLLRMSTGLTVAAKWVVVAAGYDSTRFLDRTVADIANTFALVTEPLRDPHRAQSLPQIWESHRPYVYLRGTRDGRLIMGGADVPFKSIAARDLLLPRQIGRLARAYQELFAEPLPPVDWAWAGSFAITRDSLPFIGRAPDGHPQVLYALCFGGNGITYGVHAGDMIRAAIEGRAHELDGVLGFERLRSAAESHP